MSRTRSVSRSFLEAANKVIAQNTEAKKAEIAATFAHLALEKKKREQSDEAYKKVNADVSSHLVPVIDKLKDVRFSNGTKLSAGSIVFGGVHETRAPQWLRKHPERTPFFNSASVNVWVEFKGQNGAHICNKNFDLNLSLEHGNSGLGAKFAKDLGKWFATVALPEQVAELGKALAKPRRKPKTPQPK